MQAGHAQECVLHKHLVGNTLVLLFVTDYSQHLGFLPKVSKTDQSLQKSPVNGIGTFGSSTHQVFPEHSNTVQVVVAKKHRRLFQGQPCRAPETRRTAVFQEQPHSSALLRCTSVLEEVAHFHLR